MALPPLRENPVNLQCKREDLICIAEFRAPGNIFLRFDDSMTAEIAIGDLDLSIDEFRWDSVMATETGEAVVVEDIDGELIPIDAASLRAIADPKYAETLKAAFLRLRGSLENTADRSPPDEWFRDDEA